MLRCQTCGKEMTEIGLYCRSCMDAADRKAKCEVCGEPTGKSYFFMCRPCTEIKRKEMMEKLK